MLHPKQQEIVKSNAKFKVIRAGRRAGKTYTVIEEIIFRAIKTKEARIFYIAPTQKQARDILWLDLIKRINDKGLKPNLNEARLEIEINQSIIYVAGWENKENFRGKSADLIIFDELDTMKNFLVNYDEIFAPAILDRKGKCIFIGTPKKENRNLKRLEKLAETDSNYECFHFRTIDNPVISPTEYEIITKNKDYNTIKQEFEAEYIDSSLLDVFTNTITKKGEKYLIVDVAGEGNDSTIFSIWEDLEEIKQEKYQGLSGEMIIEKIREIASQYQIPYSHIAVDAIGIGEFIANSNKLTGIIPFKSSYGAIKTEQSIITLPNARSITPLVTDFSNLRSQCIFKLAEYVNNHKIASKVTGEAREEIIEELSNYQDISKGDGKRMATMKDDIKAMIGRSPDRSDTWIMRMYFEIKEKMTDNTAISEAQERQQYFFDRAEYNDDLNSSI
jgi:hypothetical protein